MGDTDVFQTIFMSAFSINNCTFVHHYVCQNGTFFLIMTRTDTGIKTAKVS